MSERRITCLQLELACGVEPITGRIRLDDTPTRTFTGVLELITLLDEARATDDPITRPPPHESEP